MKCVHQKGGHGCRVCSAMCVTQPGALSGDVPTRGCSYGGVAMGQESAWHCSALLCSAGMARSLSGLLKVGVLVCVCFHLFVCLQPSALDNKHIKPPFPPL